MREMWVITKENQSAKWCEPIISIIKIVSSENSAKNEVVRLNEQEISGVYSYQKVGYEPDPDFKRHKSLTVLSINHGNCIS